MAVMCYVHRLTAKVSIWMSHLKLEIRFRAHRSRQVIRDRKRMVLRALQRGDHLPSH